MSGYFSSPLVGYRESLGYVGVRCIVTIGSLGEVIPSILEQCANWLKEKGFSPSGVPLIRYHTCPEIASDDAPMDVCIGYPVKHSITPEYPLVYEQLLEGIYASLLYIGVENGIAGNAELISWGNANKVEWESWKTELGDGFSGRVEHLIDGPEDDPDPSTWRSEVAIKLRSY